MACRHNLRRSRRGAAAVQPVILYYVHGGPTAEATGLHEAVLREIDSAAASGSSNSHYATVALTTRRTSQRFWRTTGCLEAAAAVSELCGSSCRQPTTSGRPGTSQPTDTAWLRVEFSRMRG